MPLIDPLTFRTALPTLLGLALVTGLTGCTDDSKTNESGQSGPLYVVGTRVWDDSSTTSYFHVVPSLAAGTVIDQQRALEVPGAAKLYAIEGAGWYAVGGGEQPTITRYEVTADGLFSERERVSLQPHGVRGLWDTLYVVSPSKMYYPDRDNQQLIVINPQAMTVEGSVPLPETAREGYLSLYGYAPIFRDGKLLISVGWFDWEEGDRVLGETGLLVLDTASDRVLRFDVETSCGGVTQPVTLDSGDTYLVSSALAGAAHRLGRLSTPPCALRIPKGSDAFDPGYRLPLRDLTSAAVVGEPVPAGDGGIFLRVFDERAADITEESVTWDLTGEAAWHWWRWDVAAGTASELTELAPSTADVVWLEVDGRVYGTATTESYAETTLIDLTSAEAPVNGLTAPGFLHGVARIR
jgi:hypothetical protein